MSLSQWLNDNDKYALIGLTVKVDTHITSKQITSDFWVITGNGFGKLPVHWSEWLGSIRSKEMSTSNLFVFSKYPSMRPEVLDDENQSLMQKIGQFYSGLLLACSFAPAYKPMLLTGSYRDGEIGIRQQQDFDPPVPGIIQSYPTILAGDIQLAAQLGINIRTIGTTALTGGHWRLFRVLSLYTEARTITDIIDRIHQYCRCIDGLILPDPGKTKQQFKSRTELFIGPGHHDMMGEIYDIRSAAEHLHENRYLESFDRAVRLDILQKEAVIEYIARNALARVIGDSNLWQHFANTSALKTFWALEENERRSLWGDPINPADALKDYNPQYIHDGLLGA